MAGSRVVDIAVRESDGLAARSEIGEAGQSLATLRFLAEASRVLSSSLDYETTLNNIAALAVPAIADICVVDILDAAGTLRRLSVVLADPTGTERVRQASEQPLNRDAPFGPARVLRTGESELVTEITDEMLVASARGPEHLKLLRQARMRSHVIVPLRARDTLFGTLTLATSHSGRRYTEADVALAEDLAARAALAVDNARLYRDAQAALHVRDEFLASVSHDLRTPLTTLRGFAQLLRRRVMRERDPQKWLMDGLEQVERAASRMDGQIADLLDINRLQAGRPLELERTATDLVALAQRTAADFSRGDRRHHISVETETDCLVGMWDAGRIERVLVNLLSNSMKYSPAGGAIVISIAQREEFALLAVRDRGIGIPAADLPFVFDRFHRGANVSGRYSGSGIGLAGTRQSVEQHGGTIAVESVEGAGTTVSVCLPLEG